MREPAFWHERDPYARRAAPVTRALLTPLASLYAWAGARRIEKTTPFHADIPVICVGNLTVGGSGKTPVVAAIRRYFEQKGFRAASLSRGYKGELEGPLKVDFQTNTAREVGDEPLMLSCHGEAWIGADRPSAAKAMQADGVQLIIMDDGHQNPTLHKDLSLVVIDGGNPWGNGFVVPKGPLREPVQVGLSRADGVIIMGKSDHKITELSGFPGAVIQSGVVPTGKAPGGPLVAFAGIGRPQKFFDTLTSMGGELADTIPYPDHHTFSDAEVDWLRQLAQERAANLITTEKDFVRLTVEQRRDILAFPVEADLPTSDIDAFLAPVLKALS